MKSTHTRGFTIVEMLIYLGLLSVFLLVLTQLFTAILDVQLESEAVSAVEQDSRFIYTRLAYDINRATSITTPPLGEGTPLLSLSIGGISYVYSLSDENLELNNDAGTDTLNSYQTHISDLSFEQIGRENGKNAIRLTFTITSGTQRVSGAEVKTVQTTIATR